jgi:GTP-binding protein EngB required for normal cell division
MNAGADGSFGGILERVSGIADEFKLGNLAPQIAACRRQLEARNGIEVAVFGRFKAGKSSLLNDLAGRTVLPVGVVPVTAVVTRIRAGAAGRAEVRFLNGAVKDIPLGDIGLFVGENHNRDNGKQVAAVEVELPELKRLAPVELVDTPGLGSAFGHNTEAALRWLPNAGAALVAVSCDAPLSERDLSLLAELRTHTPKIVLLLTKADLLSEAQRVEVLVFVREELRRKGWEDVTVYFYSVRPEERKLREKLERGLLLPLAQNRDETVAEIGQHKLASLTGQSIGYLRLALAAATQAESARRLLREKLGEERRELELLRAELQVLGREWSANALDWYLKELEPLERELEGRVTAALKAEMAGWRMRLPRLVDAWRKWLGGFLRTELEQVSAARRDMFCTPLERARQHLTRTLRAFHDRLREQVNASLGVTLAPAEFALEAPEPKAPPVDVSYGFDAAITTAGWVLPAGLFRRAVKRVLLRKARWEVEKNVSRLAADWRDRVAAGIRELTRQAEGQAIEELQTLERMAAGGGSRVAELEGAVGELEGFQRRLSKGKVASR